MAYDPAKITVEEIKEALPRLPKAQIIDLVKRIHDDLFWSSPQKVMM